MQSLQQPFRRVVTCAVIILLISFALSANSIGQAAPKAEAPEVQLPDDLNKYPGLLPEFGNLFEKLQKSVQFPSPRNHSDLLPLLPESTAFYAAVPNYGEAAHQALQTLRQERQENSLLRDWWQHGVVAATGPQIEDSIQKFYE